MTKFTTLGRKSVIGVAAAAMMVCSSAAAYSQTYVGYANPQEEVYSYTGLNNSSDVGGTLYFMVRVEASKFASYDGAQMSGIRIGWGMGEKELTPEMEVFVRESPNGEDLAHGSKTVRFGFNDISFDSPYNITSGKDIYLGGKVSWEPGSWLATGVFGYNLPENSQFVASHNDVGPDGNINWSDLTQNEMVLLMYGIVSASGEKYENKGAITKVCSNEMQSLEYPGNALIMVHNEGTNNISDFEISTSFGDKTWSHEISLSKPLESGTEKKIAGGIQALGSGTHKVWLSKINGKSVENPQYLDVELMGMSKEVIEKYTRRPLIERWVSESEYRTPEYTDDIFTPGVESFRDKVTLVSHHISDQFMIYHEFDKDVDSEDLQMLVDLADGSKQSVSVPCFSVDRSYLPENPLALYINDDKTVAYNFIYPDYVQGLYTCAIGTPTFASVNIDANVADGKCDITVKGDIEAGLLPDNEDLYLTVYILEDGIESTSQEFPDNPEVIDRYKGVFTHNDVIRTQLTEMYGDNAGEGGSYSKSYSCELDPEWNQAKMRVVAFLNRAKGGFNRMQVINSAEKSIAPASVETISNDDDVNIRINGGNIFVDGARSFSVYTLSGQRVSPDNLQSGVYVVKAETNSGVKAAKVLIK